MPSFPSSMWRALFAEKLIDTAITAPFGHGEETLFNSEVRHAGQIQPAKVRLGVGWYRDLTVTCTVDHLCLR
jgi:hypothetical protein